MGRKISVLVPAYNEAESLGELYKQVRSGLQMCFDAQQASEYEIWFVNDGSKDNTESVIKGLIAEDSKVHLISFRKNFGKSPALNAGFHHVTGDLVFTLDADLQDDPKEFTRFIQKIDEGYDLVVGWKFNRLDPAEKRLPSKLFNKVTSSLSGVKLHDHDCGFKCFRREVVESLDLYGELHRYIPVLAYRNGFRITEITVEHHKRQHGASKYGVERYMRGAFDSLTTNFLLKYSDRPMYLFGRIGVYSALLGFIICFYLTTQWFRGIGIGGRPLLLLGVLLLVVGVQFIAMGFIGNLIVDISSRQKYSESHIKEII
ncbi:glycosyltransferase family 2 protein [Butyrivibrio sp. MC2013]|uniref:glycosyltransferase family 2 protein n=1 Tax=Butyrivibrio sp. MC2013 TaxID=1280686 RepID=UPI00040D38C7|nr:glycosyltransferase family 2 protein [Butyrivibrio sp. MC2013]